MLNLENKRFGKLLAIKKTNKRRPKCNRVIWECICDCGNTCYIDTGKLTDGRVKSCGCLAKDIGKTLMDHASKGLVRIDGTELTHLLSKKIPSNSTTGVRGVSLCGTKYVAGITLAGKRYYLGRFDSLDDAKKARADKEEMIKEKYGI